MITQLMQQNATETLLADAPGMVAASSQRPYEAPPARADAVGSDVPDVPSEDPEEDVPEEAPPNEPAPGEAPGTIPPGFVPDELPEPR